MKDTFFVVRFAFRNLLRGKQKTILLGLTFIIALTILFLIFQLYPITLQAFHDKAQFDHQGVDVVITYDANASSRIINQRLLRDEFNSQIAWSVAFFNFHSLARFHDQTQTVQILSSDSFGTTLIQPGPEFTLGEYEMVITKSFAIEHHLSVDDSISLFLNNQEILFQVAYIYEDYGIFQKDTLYVNKQTLLQRVIAISPLPNLGNTLYVKLNMMDAETFIQQVFELNLYPGYRITKTVDLQSIETRARLTSSVFIGLAVLSLLTILFVLHSFIPLVYQDYREQIGIINALGGSKNYLKSVWFLQLLILEIIAFPIATILSHFIFQEAFDRYRLPAYVQMDPLILFLVTILFTLMIIGHFLLQLRHVSSWSSPAQIQDKRPLANKSSWLSFVVLMILYLTFSTLIPLPRGWKEAILFVISLFAIFSLVSFLLSKLKPLRSKLPVSLTSLISIENIATHKSYHTAIRVSVLSVLVFLLALSTNAFLHSSYPRLQEQIKVDYLLLNLFDSSIEVQDSINQHPDVESLSEAIFLKDITLSPEYNPYFVRYAISLTLEDYPLYFDFPLMDPIHPSFYDSAQMAVLLPKDLAIIQNVKIGDPIQMDFPTPIGRITAILAGRIDTDYDNMIVTNLITQENRLDQSVNAFLVNTSSNASFQEDMMKKHSAKLLAILDFEQLLQTTSEPIFELLDFLMLLVWFLLLLFSLIIWMNMQIVYQQNLSIYAVYLSLGLTIKQLTKVIYHEFVWMSGIIILISTLIYVLLFPSLPSLFLTVGYYKEIPVLFPTLLLSQAIAVGLLCFSVYFFSAFIKNKNVVELLKQR